MAKGRKRSESTYENDEMMNFLQEIGGELVNNKVSDNLLTKEDLLDSFRIWKSNFDKKDIVLSWKNKRPDLICPPYFQTSDDGWAIALSRAISTSMKMIGSTNPLPTPLTLCNGVEARHLTSTGGIDHLASAIPFVTKHYVQRMTIRRRPSLASNDDDQHEDYEKCIARLLAKAPVAVSFDCLPSFEDYDGKGIYVPTTMDCQIRLFERLPRRHVLLTGLGVEIQDGKAIEFWEVQENCGDAWGEAGFIRFARHKRLIREVYELEV